MKAKIDLEKFICSYVKWRNIQDALKDQGLKFWNGEIVEITQESEEERIRKALIDLVKSKEEDGYMVINNFSTGSILTWLEKQRKIKWTEEDEIGSDATIELLEYFINYAPEFRKPTIRRSIDWLKSLKQRMEE